MFSTIWTSNFVSLTFFLCVCKKRNNCNIVYTDKKEAEVPFRLLSFQKWCQTIATSTRGRAHPLTSIALVSKRNESNFVCKESVECNRKSLSLGTTQKCSQILVIWLPPLGICSDFLCWLKSAKKWQKFYLLMGRRWINESGIRVTKVFINGDSLAILNKSSLFLITKRRRAHMPDLDYIRAGVISLSVQDAVGGGGSQSMMSH